MGALTCSLVALLLVTCGLVVFALVWRRHTTLNHGAVLGAALIGFVAAKDPREPRRELRGGPDQEALADMRWGPTCPRPALRLWGQDVLNRVRNEYGMGRAAGDGGVK